MKLLVRHYVIAGWGSQGVWTTSGIAHLQTADILADIRNPIS